MLHYISDIKFLFLSPSKNLSIKDFITHKYLEKTKNISLDRALKFDYEYHFDYKYHEEETVQLLTDTANYNVEKSVLEKINTEYKYISFGGKPVLFVLPAKFQKMITHYKDTDRHYKDKAFAYNFLKFIYDKFDLLKHNYKIHMKRSEYLGEHFDNYIYTCGVLHDIESFSNLHKYVGYNIHITKELKDIIRSKFEKVSGRYLNPEKPSYLNYNEYLIFSNNINKSELIYLQFHNKMIMHLYRIEQSKDIRVKIDRYYIPKPKFLKDVGHFDFKIYLFFPINSWSKLLNFLYGYSHFDLPVSSCLRANDIEIKRQHEYSEFVIEQMDIDNMKFVFDEYYRKYKIDPDSVRIKSLNISHERQFMKYVYVVITNINKLAMMVTMNKMMVLNMVVRLAILLTDRYKKIREIHPNIHEDHLVACSFLIAV